MNKNSTAAATVVAVETSMPAVAEAAIPTTDVAIPTPAPAISPRPHERPASEANNRPSFIYKKIGNTKYRVAVHFSSTSKERMDDKIMRLAENDLNFVDFCGKIELPQTGRLLGGSA